MDPRSHLLRGVLAAALPGLLVLLAGSARAAPLTLRSGTTLQTARVEVLERGVRVTLTLPGGTSLVELGFEALDPIAFLAGPHAAALEALPRQRLELLAHLARQVQATQAARARQVKAAPEVPEPAGSVPQPPVPAPDPRGDETPPPQSPPSSEPPTESHAGKRLRERRPWRAAPPRVPGRQRPPLGGGAGSGTSGGR